MTAPSGSDRGGLAVDGDLFFALFESAPDAQLIVDEKGTIVLANTLAHAMFKWPAGTLVGECIDVLVPAAMADAHAEQRRRYTQAPRTRPMGAGLDLRAVRVDGSELYVEISLSPVTWRERRMVIAAVRDVTKRRLADQATMQALREQAIRDSLTGLFNRRMLDGMLRLELVRASRSQTSIAVIMADVDQFKKINDELGHDCGDVVLKKLAHVLQQQMRGGDLACRYGGEEFVLILPGCGLEVAAQRAEHLRELVNRTDWSTSECAIPALTSSFGVAVYPLHGDSPAGLLKAADEALRRAKAQGRNRVVEAAAVPA